MRQGQRAGRATACSACDGGLRNNLGISSWCHRHARVHHVLQELLVKERALLAIDQAMLKHVLRRTLQPLQFCLPHELLL